MTVRQLKNLLEAQDENALVFYIDKHMSVELIEENVVFIQIASVENQ